MSVKKLVIGMVAALLLIIPTAGAEETAETAPYAATVEVGVDDAGDWGGSPEEHAVGEALGQDLTKASIGMPTADTVNFTINVTKLPGNGGVPEVSRYVWDMLVDGKFVELDGKWTNYTRGACDPTAGACPPPRDPGTQPFFIRGNCVAGQGNVTTCTEIGRVKATFDAATGTITVPVPAALIKAQPCSVIEPGPNLFGGTVSATPAAFVSSSAAPNDTLLIETLFQVPSGDPAVTCPTPAPSF